MNDAKEESKCSRDQVVILEGQVKYYKSLAKQSKEEKVKTDHENIGLKAKVDSLKEVVDTLTPGPGRKRILSDEENV